MASGIIMFELRGYGAGQVRTGNWTPVALLSEAKNRIIHPLQVGQRLASRISERGSRFCSVAGDSLEKNVKVDHYFPSFSSLM